MRLSEYQIEATKTDQAPMAGTDEERLKALMLPLLGLCGETGSLLTHFKRFLRDGEKYSFFRERISEELGDILWNVSNVATKAELSLEDIARDNLKKIADRWIDSSYGLGVKFFDEEYASHERLPRRFEIEISASSGQGGRPISLLHYQEKPFGNSLSDNSEIDDGYRHHDVFHLAFVAMLGWSPVMRGKMFFDCKRRSNPDVDEIQDGGRAAVIEEAIAALIFVEARRNSFYDGVEAVEFSVLRTIKDLTAHLEVSQRTAREWESAILTGFRVWRQLQLHRSGTIRGDLIDRELIFIPE